MSYSIAKSEQRITANNYVIDTNNNVLGGFASITTSSATLNLSPTGGVLDRYFYTYYIKTDVAVTVTLPITATTTKGWKCRIILFSPTSAGSLVIKDSAGTTVAGLSSPNSASKPSVELILVKNATLGNWFPIYSTYNVPRRSLFVVNGAGFVVNTPMSLGNFTAFSGLVGTTLNVNNTVLVPIPWSSAATGFYQDNIFFTQTSTTQITCLRACNVRLKSLAFVNNLGGATSVNTFSVTKNGGSFGTPIVGVISGTISLSASVVFELTTYSNLAAGDVIDLRIGKTASSGGTNPLDQGITSINIQVINS
jgi:hypothetical protein